MTLEMPEWSTIDGPWCLKRWLPLPSGVPPKFDVCLLPPNHEGDCRTIHYGYRNNENALYLGDS